ncbi:tetratricopeptide repeat protein [Burkholderia contaminans]|uniref:tetratricopeptide repeat protein n=1 Tax=Burkholderia contaminans TaxID=488447 RepID=UPI0015C68E5F|nr:tetratricopeptide repeat protein [Burkholderia contaminans]
MAKLSETYIKYGVSIDLALKYEGLKLSVSSCRALSSIVLSERFGIDEHESAFVKRCISRQPIDEDVVHKLLEASNYLCCCCKGKKSDSYIIHHIEEYEKSQNNSYENLAVLCPNDHDLAHSQSNLTIRLTREHIRKSKLAWELQVRLHNVAAADSLQRDQVLLKLPRYVELTQEIERLNVVAEDRKKIIDRTDAYFQTEINQYQFRLDTLEREKSSIEEQVEKLATQLAAMDFDRSSSLTLKASSYFLSGNLEAALAVLNESALDEEFAEMEGQEQRLASSMLSNAHARLLRAKLLFIDGSTEDAAKAADYALTHIEKLASTHQANFNFELISALEEVGSLHYNICNYQKALDIFEQGDTLSNKLYGEGEVAHLPVHILIVQNIGACYYSMGLPQRALEYLEQAYGDTSKLLSTYRPGDKTTGSQPALIELFEKNKLMILTNIGASRWQTGDHAGAISAYLQAKDVCERLIQKNDAKDNEAVFRYYHGLGASYFQTSNYQEALNAYQRAVDVSDKLTDREKRVLICELADLYRDVCSCHLQLNDAALAMRYCDAANDLYDRMDPRFSTAMSMHHVDAILYKIILTRIDLGDEMDVEFLRDKALAICDRYPDEANKHGYRQIIDNVAQKPGHRIIDSKE